MRHSVKTMNWRRLRGYGYGLGVRTLIDKAESGSNSSIGEIGWGGAAGATIIADTEEKSCTFLCTPYVKPTRRILSAKAEKCIIFMLIIN